MTSPPSQPDPTDPRSPAPSPAGHPSPGKFAREPAGSEGRPAENIASDEFAHFVTSIKNTALQIGEHVMAALQHGNTVAVLTTVVVGPGGEHHIMSAALGPGKLAQVNALLREASIEREEEEPCVGFHCLLKSKSDSSH